MLPPHDPVTGEIVAGEAAPPTEPQPHSGGGAADNSEAIAKADRALIAAAAQGMEALKAAWTELPKEMQLTLKTALERRHKATAIAADKAGGKCVVN